jgi:hypothetical protein
MKYLSWDIGIKNLSYCLTDEECNILNWEVINVSGDIKEEFNCDGTLKNGSRCNSKGKFYNLETKKIYCNKHSKDFINLVDTTCVKCCHILPSGTNCGKRISFESGEKFRNYCKPHAKKYEDLKEIKKDSKGTLDDIILNLIGELDKRPYLLDVDVITIENQPAFKNPRMKSIQMIIYTYFNMRGRVDIKNSVDTHDSESKYINRILFLSASNKLKIKFEGKEEIEKNCDITNKYKKNKELAKLFCLEYLNPEWEVFFKNHKKRDDLADTFLMNVYQIQIDKKK